MPTEGTLAVFAVLIPDDDGVTQMEQSQDAWAAPPVCSSGGCAARPSPVQYPPLFGCGTTFPKAPTHRLLLQMAFGERLNFAIGDGGSLYLTGRPADLRAGRFDRL